MQDSLGGGPALPPDRPLPGLRARIGLLGSFLAGCVTHVPRRLCDGRLETRHASQGTHRGTGPPYPGWLRTRDNGPKWPTAAGNTRRGIAEPSPRPHQPCSRASATGPATRRFAVRCTAGRSTPKAGGRGTRRRRPGRSGPLASPQHGAGLHAGRAGHPPGIITASAVGSAGLKAVRREPAGRLGSVHGSRPWVQCCRGAALP